MPIKYPYHILIGALILLCLITSSAFAKENVDSKREIGTKSYNACNNSFINLHDLNKKKYMIIDVRKEKEYYKNHIPNSMNIPLYKLQRLNILKGNNVLLVNDGFTSQELVKACKQLALFGVDSVKILRGGMCAWKKGKYLDKNARKKGLPFCEVTAERLFSASNSNLITLKITDKFNDQIAPITGTDYYFPAHSPAKQLLNFISKITHKSKISPDETTFVVTVDKETFLRIFSNYNNELDKYNIWQLTGGLKHYNAYVLKQEKIGKKKEFVLQKNRGCTN